MLYDTRWDKPVETKPDPFALETLIAWLEKQPAQKEYNFADCEGGCLIAIFGTALGVDWRDIHSRYWDRSHLDLASCEPHTFGAALDRARKLVR